MLIDWPSTYCLTASKIQKLIIQIKSCLGYEIFTLEADFCINLVARNVFNTVQWRKNYNMNFRIVVCFASHNGNYCCFECCFLSIVLTFQQTVDHQSISWIHSIFVKSKWKMFNHKTTRRRHFVLKDGSCSTKNLLA